MRATPVTKMALNRCCQGPANNHLCKHAGIKPHDFSRCLDDDSAREIKVYWGMTENIEQIMSFRKKAVRRRQLATDCATELPAGYRG